MCGTVPSGRADQARCDPGAPGCLPGLRPPLPRLGFVGVGVRPGRSSADGAMDELPLLRSRRRRSSRTSSANATGSDRSSSIAPACSAITASRAAYDAQPGAGDGRPVTTGHRHHRPPTSQAATPGQFRKDLIAASLRTSHHPTANRRDGGAECLPAKRPQERPRRSSGSPAGQPLGGPRSARWTAPADDAPLPVPGSSRRW